MDARFDILAYVESKVERAKRSAGSEMTGLCPACHRYGGFYVNVDSGSFVCFKCEFKGRSVIRLVAQVEGIDEHEARSLVFRRSVPLRRKSDLITLAERIKLLRPHASAEDVEIAAIDDPLPSEFRPCYRSVEGKDVWELPPYLKDRGIKSRTIRAWGMGYVSKKARHSRACLESGEERCIPGCSWRFRGRLVIPVSCPNGRSFTARDMTGRQMPRYLNPTGTDFRRLLIGWNTARMTGDIVICEGPLDAVKLWQHSISAVALGGKELHDEQLAMLMSAFPSDTVVTIMLDPEEELGPIKVAERLSTHFKHVYIAHLLELDSIKERGPLDPGNSTVREAMAAIDNASKWTGARSIKLSARLARSRRSVASRWG